MPPSPPVPLNNPRAIAIESPVTGNVWVYDATNGLSRIDGYGNIVYQFYIDPYDSQGNPQRMIMGPGSYNSNIYMADWANGSTNNQVASFDTIGHTIVSNIASFDGNMPSCITCDNTSNLYVGFANGLVKKIDLSNNSQTTIVDINGIIYGGLVGISCDSINNTLYIAGPSNISVIDLTLTPPISSAGYSWTGDDFQDIKDIVYVPGGDSLFEDAIVYTTPFVVKVLGVSSSDIIATVGLPDTQGFKNGAGPAPVGGGSNLFYAPNMPQALCNHLSALAFSDTYGFFILDSDNNAIRTIGPIYPLSTLYPHGGGGEPAPPCFLEGTRILCKVKPTDTLDYYVPIEQIKKGSLVKTSRDGYKKVVLIGKASINNTDTDERTENRLYKLTPANYPELKEDLYITGHHSVLVDSLTEQQKEDTLKYVADVFGTDGKARLMARVDDRAVPWQSAGTYTIWHFALETADVYKNFGVYANGGLLVETCCIKLLKEESNMTFV